MMTEPEIRADFEAWVSAMGYSVQRFDADHEYAGNYVFIDVQLAFAAWTYLAKANQ